MAEGETVGAFLCEITDVFSISGRGCVMFPGIPLGSPLRVQINAPIRLIRPDGSELVTRVAGIEMISTSQPHPTPLLLPKEIDKSQVPLGTKVYLEGDGAR